MEKKNLTNPTHTKKKKKRKKKSELRTYMMSWAMVIVRMSSKTNVVHKGNVWFPKSLRKNVKKRKLKKQNKENKK